MSLTLSHPEGFSPSGRRASPRFVAQVATDWELAEQTWAHAMASGASTPFQTSAWLRPWFATLGRSDKCEPRFLTLIDRESGQVAALVPQIITRKHGATIAQFPDAGVSDANAPVLGPKAPSDRAGANELFNAVKAALGDVDLIDWRKMPGKVEERVNPFTQLTAARRCPTDSFAMTFDGSWDDYKASLKKKVRYDVERGWRVLQGDHKARFVRASDPESANDLLSWIETCQRARIVTRGQNYTLDDPATTAFYHELLADGVAAGTSIVSAIVAGDEIVAATLAQRRGTKVVFVRLAVAGGDWMKFSPGRVLLYRTMAPLHDDGVRTIDFSIGNYAYKRRLGVEPYPLMDLVTPLTWRGTPLAARAAAIHHLRRYPRLDKGLRRALGIPYQAFDVEVDQE